MNEFNIETILKKIYARYKVRMLGRLNHDIRKLKRSDLQLSKITPVLECFYPNRLCIQQLESHLYLHFNQIYP